MHADATAAERSRGGATRRRGIVGALVGLALLALTPDPAHAHTELRSTTPGDGERLDEAPARVVLHFTGSVDMGDDGVQVYAASGDRLDTDAPEHPDGDATMVAVDLPPLDDGEYVVSWQTTSPDGHPLTGAFTFRVASGSGDRATAALPDHASDDGSAARPDEADHSSPVRQEEVDHGDAAAVLDAVESAAGASRALGAVYGVARFAAFGGLSVLVGAAAFMLVLWPAGAGERRVRRLVVASWGVAIVATAASIGLQGAYGAGLSLPDALDPSIVWDELGTRPGRSWAVRLVLLAGAAVFAPLLARRAVPAVSTDGHTAEGGTADGDGIGPVPTTDDPAQGSGVRVPRRIQVPVAVAGLALLATVSAVRHAATGDLVPLAFVIDVAHLGGVSVWLGGLTVLAVVLGRSPSGSPATSENVLEPVVRRFSRWAFAAVVVIVATGVVQSWRQVGSVDALTDTTYGRLLLAKVTLVAAMLGAAAVSRAYVHGRWGPTAVRRPALSLGPGAVAASEATTRGGVHALRASVAAEAIVAIAVLAVTALLVNAAPGRSAIKQGALGAEIHHHEVIADLGTSNS